MIQGIFGHQKIRVITIIFILFVCILVFLLTRKLNFYDKTYSLSDEFLSVSGNWNVTDYLGEADEYHGAERTTLDEEIEHKKFVTELKEKYLDKKLEITSNNILSFYPPDELGFNCKNWDELFMRYRQPPDIWNDSLPPFLCASFKLKGYNDSLDIIMDANGRSLLVVKGQFFQLEKTAKSNKKTAKSNKEL